MKITTIHNLKALDNDYNHCIYFSDKRYDSQSHGFYQARRKTEKTTNVLHG